MSLLQLQPQLLLMDYSHNLRGAIQNKMSQIVEKVQNKLGLSSAKLSRAKFGYLEAKGPEEMPILVWGRRKSPQTKIGST